MQKSTVFTAFAAASLLGTAHFARADFSYQYDDGIGNVRTTTRFAADMLWGNVYQSQPGADVITQISVGFGRLVTGTPIRLWVFDDPNDDFDPRDAVLLSESLATSGPAGLGIINQYTIQPVRVSGVFFVAVSTLTDGGINAVPARVDVDGAAFASRSWIFAADTIDGRNLGGSPYSVNLTQNVPQGTFVVRATGIPAPAPAGLLAGVLVAASRRRR